MTWYTLEALCQHTVNQEHHVFRDSIKNKDTDQLHSNKLFIHKLCFWDSIYVSSLGSAAQQEWDPRPKPVFDLPTYFPDWVVFSSD